MTDVGEELLKDIGRAVIEQSRGMPGPNGYLLAPATHIAESGVNFECPACPGLHPKSGGGGHKDECPLKEVRQNYRPSR